MTATEHTDSVNSKILAVSEDQIQGFVREPFKEIARLSGIDEEVVLDRIKAMLTRRNDSTGPPNAPGD